MSLTAKLIALGLLLLALTLGAWRLHAAIDQGGYDRAETIYKSAIAAQKTEAARVLAEETAKVTSIEVALKDFKSNQELRDGKNKTTVSDLERRLAALAGPVGRLRDPNAPGCGGGSSDAPGEAGTGDGDRAADGATAPGLLSAELSRLLLADTKKADAINNAYISCRAQLFGDREQLK